MYKIKPSELDKYIGKRVNTKQLNDILDTYMILTNIKIIEEEIAPSTVEGILDQVSTNPIRITKKNSVVIFNDSFERDEYCGYE